jgi:hypothetical protein
MPETLVGLTVRPPENLMAYTSLHLSRHGFDMEAPFEATITSHKGDFVGVEFVRGNKTFLINFAPSVLEYRQGDEWLSFENLP